MRAYKNRIKNGKRRFLVGTVYGEKFQKIIYTLFESLY
jgi:hypothetical protein